MKRTALYLFPIFILFSLPRADCRAQAPFSAETSRLIEQGIDLTFRMEFDSSLAVFQRVCDRLPDHPAGYFHKAAALQSRMMDLETDKWETQFHACLDTAEIKAESLLRQDPDNAWIHFYLGSSRSYRGLYEAKAGHLVNGFISAKSGLSSLQRAVELDSTLHDAWLGLGSYSYWAGRFYRYLKWLPWIQDKRTEGIRQVARAAEQGRFTRWVGLNSLAWIQWDRDSTAQAMRLFRKGLDRYPGSRFFLWGIADTHYRAENYAEAIPWYHTILRSVRAEEDNNRYNEIVCLVKIARCSFETQAYETAFQTADETLDIPLGPKIRKRLKEQLKEAETLRRRALVKLGRITTITR